MSCSSIKLSVYFIFIPVMVLAWTTDLRAQTSSPPLKTAKASSSQAFDPSVDVNDDIAEPPISSRTKHLRRRPTRWHLGASADVGMIYYGTGYGFEGWLGFAKDQQVGVSLLVNSATTTSTDPSGAATEELDSQLQQINLFYRYFLGDSFYISGGISENQISGKYGFRVKSNASQGGFVNYNFNFISPGVSCGSQWVLAGGVVIGIEWIGYTPIIAGSLNIKDNSASASYTTVAFWDNFLSNKTPENIISKNLQDGFGLYYMVARIGYSF